MTGIPQTDEDARILLVDTDPTSDNLFSRRITSEAAGRTYSFDLAEDDEAAKSLLLNDGPYMAALVSIDRGGISGLDLFRKLGDRRVRVPRVAVTDGRDMDGIRQALAKGAVDFLTRPLETSDLRTTLDRVLDDVARRRRNWEERAAYFALKREVDVAANIQSRILPTDFPDMGGFDLHAAMTPAKTMGGDFYDVFEISPGRIGVTIADVSGKGVPAAFYMAVARTLLRGVGMTGVSPEDCLAEVNRLLCGHQIPGMFVSCFYGVINTDTGDLKFANGGHQAPFKRDESGTVTPLGGGEGMVLGVVEDVDFEGGQTTLEPGTFLYLFTDGISEAFDEDRNMFGEDGIAIELQNVSSLTADAVADQVTSAMGRFVGTAEQSDDITSVVLVHPL